MHCGVSAECAKHAHAVDDAPTHEGLSLLFAESVTVATLVPNASICRGQSVERMARSKLNYHSQYMS